MKKNFFIIADQLQIIEISSKIYSKKIEIFHKKCFVITDRAAAGLSTCSARLGPARDEEVVKINSFNFKSGSFQ